MASKFLIIEDDPIISNTIKTTLEKNNAKVVGIAKDYENALHFINTKKPDVCLIDIQLKGNFDGINIAKELDKLKIPYFYLTAQTDPITLAEVGETHPLGYLVKPFTAAGLWSSISVIWNKYLAEKENIFIVKSDGYTHKILENDILYLEAFDNYCYIHLQSKKLLVPHTLKKVSEQLQGNHFFASHRSYYVNTNKITNIGKNCLHINNIEIALSEARKPKLLKFLNS